MKTLNQKTVTVKLRRSELCDLLIACAWVATDAGGDSSNKWVKLHDILKEQLNDFDSKEANK